MIFAALPILEAEEILDSLFVPAISEDLIYDLAMTVHQDEIKAKQLVKVYATSKSSAN